MGRHPLVSIIIPTYNRLYALGELLESLARQSFRDFEVVVVNDCGEAVEPVCALYSELAIRIINMEQNSKHVHARNAGLAVARGKYIMLCDDDDLLTPNHLQNMMQEIVDVDLVFSDVEIFNYSIEGTRRKMTNRLLFAYEYEPAFMRKFSTFVSSGCLYRKAIHEVIGPFDVEMHNYWDWDFILRTMEKFKVKRVPVASALYAFSGSGDNMSANLSTQRNVFLEKLCAKHQLGELPQKNFFTLLEEPEIITRKAESTVVWDGEIPRGRASVIRPPNN